MRAHRVLLVLVVGLVSCVVRCRQIQQGSDIPLRCIQASVTAVSCDQDTPDNLLPHPDDCELFYYCVSREDQPVCRQCPAHLHFNPQLHVCDQPAVAGCRHNATTEAATLRDLSTLSTIAA